MGERSIRVRVPGTSANCGPGFDTLGIACTIYNELELTLRDQPGLEFFVEGEGEDNIPLDDRNVVWRSVRYLLERAGMAEKFQGGVIRMKNEVPLSRGLGSSATAIVAGLKAANVLMDNVFNRRELLQFATKIEGHPDNVAPAIFGGFTVNIVSKGKAQCFSFLPKLRMKMVAAVPDFPLSTRMAREVLPEKVSRQDAIFNIGRASLLVAALCKGNEYFLRQSFEDVLHQPYRAELVPGMMEVFAAARNAGALGATLSGAGPCLMAYVLERDRCAREVGEAMVEAFRKNGVNAKALALNLDTRGAHIINE
ncbi:MAG: homoserine kinase [Selenomonadaceae bacterium]|nr:homoserine kinase [Selenomonadaceae bacterium]